MPDLERLQTALDEFSEMAEWAVKWIAVLEEEVSFARDSDSPVFAAEVVRLRIIGDAIVPGRVRDDSSGRRWYLAPDEVQQREDPLSLALTRADEAVARALEDVRSQRKESERREREASERDRNYHAKRQQERRVVKEFLQNHGPATAKEIASESGISASWAATIAGEVSKRGRDGRYRLEPS